MFRSLFPEGVEFALGCGHCRSCNFSLLTSVMSIRDLKCLNLCRACHHFHLLLEMHDSKCNKADRRELSATEIALGGDSCHRVGGGCHCEEARDSTVMSVTTETTTTTKEQSLQKVSQTQTTFTPQQVNNHNHNHFQQPPSNSSPLPNSHHGLFFSQHHLPPPREPPQH